MKVFISWSGPRSQTVAEALRDWLPNVIQAIEPWISSSDIEKGTRWGTDIAAQLEQTTVGIICLTSENLTAPWVLFEAGALSKTLEDTFVCPYLVDIEPANIQGPLVQFQATRANKEDTRKLILTINRAQNSTALPDDRVNKAFETWWPELERRLESVSSTQQQQTPPRPDRDILEEILELVRSQSRESPRSTEQTSFSITDMINSAGGIGRTNSIRGTTLSFVEHSLETANRMLASGEAYLAQLKVATDKDVTTKLLSNIEVLLEDVQQTRRLLSQLEHVSLPRSLRISFLHTFLAILDLESTLEDAIAKTRPRVSSSSKTPNEV